MYIIIILIILLLCLLIILNYKIFINRILINTDLMNDLFLLLKIYIRNILFPTKQRK